ncbi:hypothetical protein Tco_0008866 [Tanacetum coccineum]
MNCTIEGLSCGGRGSAPPSPDYVPGPEEPEQAPPSPDYVPGLRSMLMDEIIPEEDDDEALRRDPIEYAFVALPATAPSTKETEPFKTDESAATPPPHPAYRMTARITIPELISVPAWMRAEAAATSHSLPLLPPFILSPTRPDAPPPMPTSLPPLYEGRREAPLFDDDRQAGVLGQITDLLPLWTRRSGVTQRDMFDNGITDFMG